MNTSKLENLVKECNRLKKILYDNRESMSNLNFILLRDVLRPDESEMGGNVETPDDIRRILKVKIEKIEGQIKQLVNDETAILEEENDEELTEESNKPTDTELLDFLQQELDKSAYTGKVVCRKSTTGRGWRLHETSRNCGILDVRQAIADYVKQVRKGKV